MNGLRRSACSIACILTVFALSAVAQEPVASEPRWNEAQKSVVDSARKYVAAYDSHDLKTLEEFFAEDARLVTVDGEVFEGRESILELLRAGFEGNPGSKMSTDIHSVRLIGDAVAIETGFLSTRTASDPRDDVVAYEIVHVKRDGRWRMFEIFESSPADEGETQLHAEKLAALDFLAGEWIEESESATIRHLVRWSPNHRWLLVEYDSESPDGKPLRFAEQRIGWDPRRKAIRSWLFEEDGGQTDCTWTRSADGAFWTIQAEGVLADGRTIASTLKLEPTAKDRIRIEARARSVDGVAQPDARVRILVRKPPAGPLRAGN